MTNVSDGHIGCLPLTLDASPGQASQIHSHARLPLPASMMVSCNIYRVDFYVCCRGRAKQSGSLGFCPYSTLPKHRKQTV